MEVKLVLVGNTTVGKTCIVKREVMGVYEELMQPTLGAAYTSREVHVKDRTVSVQMWDTAGQERYKAMGPMYYHGVNVALIVYAVDSRSSFAAVDEWVDDIRKHAPRNVQLVIVANKIDLVDSREVAAEEGVAKAESHSALYFEVSAKTGEGISDMFLLSITSFLEKGEMAEKEKSPRLVNQEQRHGRNCC